MLKSGSFSSYAEVLAWASAGDNINNGDFRSVDLGYITEMLHPSPPFFQSIVTERMIANSFLMR